MTLPAEVVRVRCHRARDADRSETSHWATRPTWVLFHPGSKYTYI